VVITDEPTRSISIVSCSLDHSRSSSRTTEIIPTSVAYFAPILLLLKLLG
jgi:hypothetical protein